MSPSPAELASYFSARVPHAEREDVHVEAEPPDLHALLQPVTVQAFAENHFGREPLYLAAHERRSELYSLARLRAALSRACRTRAPGFELRATFSSGAALTRQLFSIDYAQISAILEHGGTICVTGLHRIDEAAAALAASSRVILGHAGQSGINCYLSAANSGFLPHFDARVATSIQVAGSKTWQYGSQPALAFPPRNWLAGRGTEFPVGNGPAADWEVPTSVSETELTEITLDPGALLCLPAGTWHAARAEGFSLALNLYFEHTDFSAVVAEVLAEHFRPRSAWRAGVPPMLDREGNVRAAAVAYVQERIHELSQFVSTLADDEQPVLDAAIALLAGGGREPPEVPRTSSAGLAGADIVTMPTTPPTFVCVRRDTAQQPVVSLAQGEMLLHGGEEHAQLFRALATRRSFVLQDLLAEQASEDLSKDEIGEVIQCLVESGVARVAAAGATASQSSSCARCVDKLPA